jgi:hypothetical protein
MKSLKDYISEAEYAIDNPVVGDYFDIVVKELICLESEVIELTEDGIVILGDDHLFQVLESNNLLEGMYITPDAKGVEKIMPHWVSPLPHPIPHQDEFTGKSTHNTEKSVDNPNGDITQQLHVKALTKKKSKKVTEAEYHGRTVPLGKPMAGDVKKSKVYVKNPKTGKVIKVNFGDPNMRIKKSSPSHRKSFRARHNCANPGPRTKARYWSCRAW